MEKNFDGILPGPVVPARNQYAGEQLSFLPPPPFNPAWPTRGTLLDFGLEMFLQGRMIDHPEFEDETQSWRLSAVVCELKDMGWPIERIDIPSPTQRKFNRIIGLYHLPQVYIGQALAIRGAV